MYYRICDKVLRLKRTPNDDEIAVSLSDFSLVSSVRGRSGGDELFLVGVRVGGELPDYENKRQGDLRLYTIRLGEMRWRCVSQKYAESPVPIPSSDFVAFSGEKCVTVVDSSGALILEAKRRQPPTSLSVSPNGKRILWLEWAGDVLQVRALSLPDNDLKKYKTSCFGYSWYDDDHILYYLCGGLKLLNLETGKSRLFINSLSSIVRGMSDDEVDDEIFRFIRQDGKKEFQYDNVACVGDKIYFTCLVSETLFKKDLKWYHSFFPKKTDFYYALFSINKSKDDLNVVHSFPDDQRIAFFEADEKGNVFFEVNHYKGYWLMSDRTPLNVGPDTDFLNDGWRMLRYSCESQLYHAIL